MSRLWKLSLAVAIIVSLVRCDRVTKEMARQALVGSAPISLLGGVVTLQYTENLGAFLGLGSNLPEGIRSPLGIATTILIIVVAAAYLLAMREANVLYLVCLAMLVGGGIGNLIDRLVNHGAVPDFVVVGYGPLHTGVFNVADVAITFGALALALLVLLERPEAEESSEHGDSGPPPTGGNL